MTEQELQNLLQKYRVPKHILKHVKKVAAVTLFLGQKMGQAGESVDLIVVRQAALLHDFLKLCDFKELDLTYFDQNYSADDVQFWSHLIKSCHKDGHEMAAYYVLKDLGEDQLAMIVRRHGFRALVTPGEIPETWEEKLVYYADKRVKHDEVVSVAERLRDGRKRYYPEGGLPAHHPHVEKALYVLEKELCGIAGIHPEEITEEAVVDFLE